jgi:hypothetical protein
MTASSTVVVAELGVEEFDDVFRYGLRRSTVQLELSRA